MDFSRSFSLEDISIRSGPGTDGREVTAYASVFDVPVPIRDQDGEYTELIDRSAFNKAIKDAAPSGSRKSWRCGVFYNHARTLYGTPSETHSVPIGVCQHMEADSRGLLTVTRYLPAADNILDAIREGAIQSYSFQGAFLRSSPTASGRFRKDAKGNLPTVRRLESSLREYGPTPTPAYADAEIVGVRAEYMVEQLAHMTDEDRQKLIEMLQLTTRDASEPENVDTSTTEAVTGEPLEEHSARHHQHALWRIRTAELLAAKGIVLPEPGAEGASL
jgi:phage head maturation protease